MCDCKPVTVPMCDCKPDCKPVTVPTEPTEVIDKMIAESEAHMSILRHLRNLAEFTKDIPEMLDAFHQVILPGLRRIR